MALPQGAKQLVIPTGFEPVTLRLGIGRRVLKCKGISESCRAHVAFALEAAKSVASLGDFKHRSRTDQLRLSL